MTTIDLDRIERELIEAGVPKVARTGTNWLARFDIGGVDQVAMLLVPSTEAYLVAIAPIESPLLTGDLDLLPAPVLRVLLRKSSEVAFAKIDFFPSEEGSIVYVASSECSAEDVSGSKLRRRLEACAVLAVNVQAALAVLDAKA